MRKPPSLRAHLTAALPEFARDPERLMMFVLDGRIATTGTAALGWQWHYTLRTVLCDFTGHPDAAVGPILVWLRAHQSDLLNNPQSKGQAIRIQAEYLNTQALDLVLDLQLTESVHARALEGGAPGAFELLHRAEPPGPADMPHDPVTSLYLNGQQLAAWPPLNGTTHG
ncbi:phage tail protein [Comamonas sp. CMM01]|uniref:phage tail protein n=1 Tax=Comamonas sp. CMM01 TaxID=2769280 RepID=UPI001780CA83|nr:phage tail protein [Comamonas sp. CMM01]MBD9530646.1 phage tail protein [Comamonas sp. CMM01]